MTVQGSIDNGNLGSTFLMNEKQEAREKAIQVRVKLHIEDQEISSTRIKEIWNNVKGGFDLKSVGFYWPTKGEISSLPIIEELLKEGSKCFLPIVNKNPENRRLIFKEYTENTKLEMNRFLPVTLMIMTFQWMQQLHLLDLFLSTVKKLNKLGCQFRPKRDILALSIA